MSQVLNAVFQGLGLDLATDSDGNINAADPNLQYDAGFMTVDVGKEGGPNAGGLDFNRVKGKTGAKGFAKKAMPLSWIAGTAGLSAYGGYQESGVSGAAGWMATDFALEHAVQSQRWAGAAKMGAGTQAAKFGLMGYAGRSIVGGLGSAAGWGLGGAVGGAIGGVAGETGRSLGGWTGAVAGGAAGAYAGAYAAPMLANPYVLGGALAVGVGVGATAGAAYGVAKGGYELQKRGRRHAQMQRMINSSGDMGAFMTRNAFTMRSRAVSAIRGSHLNARSILGQEASFLHSRRNFFSQYR